MKKLTPEMLSFFAPWGNEITFAFVDGNHENFDMLYKYPVEEWNEGKVHRITPNIIHLMRGEIYTVEGKTIFTFGGGTSVDKERRLEKEKKVNEERKSRGLPENYKIWWEQEQPTVEEIQNAWSNLKRVNYKVDYIITHTASLSMMKVLLHWVKEDTILNHFLDEIREKVQYKVWYFGHFHDNRLYVKDKTLLLFDKIVQLGHFYSKRRYASVFIRKALNSRQKQNFKLPNNHFKLKR